MKWSIAIIKRHCHVFAAVALSGELRRPLSLEHREPERCIG